MQQRSGAGGEREPLETFLRKHIPFLSAGSRLGGAGLADRTNIESFVREIVARCLLHPLASGSGRTEDRLADHEMLETDRHICVRYPIPEAAEPGAITLHVSRSRLRIGMGQRSVVIELPAEVVPDDSLVCCRDGWLEIRLRKSPEKPPFREYSITP